MVQDKYCCAGVGELIQSRRKVSDGIGTACWTATARGKIRNSLGHLLLQHMQSPNSKLFICCFLRLYLTSALGFVSAKKADAMF